MKIFTTVLFRQKNNKFFKSFQYGVSLIFWLSVWQTASSLLDQEMLLSSPAVVVQRLIIIVQEKSFWLSVAFSLSRVLLGFSIAALIGLILAVTSLKFKFIEILLSAFIGAVKAMPVASYVILCLILFPSAYLSVLISFLMGLPIMYINVLQGLKKTDNNLLEMAQVFRMNTFNKWVYIYALESMPYFLSACSIALGLCWKAGIAAEVIGLTKNSIGERLYNAKIYYDMPDLIAWTVVIIFVSFMLERILIGLIKKIATAIEGR